MAYHSLLFVLVPLFALSAFFSGSEVALFSIDKKKLETANRNQIVVKSLLALLDTPRRLLVTILIGNTMVNTFASIISTLYTLQLAENQGWNVEIALVVQVIILTLVLLIFGEISPKVFAARRPTTIAFTVAVPLYWINIFLYPISEVMTELIKLLFSKFHFHKAKVALTQEEIHHLASVGHEKGAINEDEHDLIKSVVEAKNTVVREIMTHRTQIITAPGNISREALINLLLSSTFSRIPVYNGDIDHIIGVIYAKDVLRFLDPAVKEHFSLTKILRKPLIVPETKYINDLMKEFQEKKQHLAVVVDEYGGTAGIVTLEDIIEEMIGELRDEISGTGEFVREQSDGSFLVNAGMGFIEFREHFNVMKDIPDIDFETVAGWILDYTGVIPKSGYSFICENLRITISQLSGNKIQSIRVDLIS